MQNRPAKGAPAAGDDSQKRILVLLAAFPGITKTELCQATGLAWGTVCYHIERLQGQDAVVGERSGRSMRLRLSELGHAFAQSRVLAVP